MDGRPLRELWATQPCKKGSNVSTPIRDCAQSDVPVRLDVFPMGAFVGRNLIAGLVYLAVICVAVLVFRRCPNDHAAHALLLCMALTGCGVIAWLLGGSAAVLATTGPSAWQFLGELVLALIWAATLHFALVLPGTRLRPRRGTVAFVYALPLLCYGLYLAIYLPSARGAAEVAGRLAQVSLAASTFLPVASVVLTFVSYRSMTDQRERRRTRLVLAPFYVAVAGFVGMWSIPAALNLPVLPENLIPLLFLPCGLALAAAVLRYGWFDIELILRRSLLYAGLSVCVLTIFLGTTWLLSRVAGPRPGLGALMASAVVALTAQPLRRYLQRRVGRLVYGDRDDPYEVMSRLGSIDAAAAPQRVLQDMVETLARVLRLRYAAVELDVVAARCGHSRGDPVIHELTHGREVLGRLVLEVGAGREPFGRADQELIDATVQQVGATASAILLGSRLQASRERLVLAREEERRQLHHRLHDGLGPGMAASAMQLETARTMVHRAPANARAALDTVIGNVHELIADVRRLVYDLRPPALDELGLADAIRARLGVGRVSTDGDLDGLPAAVEVAAFWIAVEAVNNAVRHGDAESCRVRLTRSRNLSVEVSDHGPGLPDRVRPGGGLLSMRERAEQLGGTWTIESLPGGGTVVRAVLPTDAGREGSPRS